MRRRRLRLDVVGTRSGAMSMSTAGAPTGSATRSCSSLFTSMFDDAAIFPPGNAPMERAVDEHRVHRDSWYADFVGPSVCSADRLPELDSVLADRDGDVLDVSLTVPGGPAALIQALRTAADCVHVRVVAAELPMATFAPAELAAVRRSAGSAVATYVEVPMGAGTAEVVDTLGAHGLRLKLRTGGETAGSFPAEPTLATAIGTAVDEWMPFKCTAGLHSAVRHRDRHTGLERHGFLNVMLAVHAALAGADVGAALAETDRGHVAACIAALDAAETAQVRKLFRSFGTCSVAEPLADLQALGLVGKQRDDAR